jgi:hypothetical protein
MFQVEGIPRCEGETNVYNYTKVELAKKEKAVKDMMRDYPQVPKKWCDWLYDVIGHMPEDEVEKIINEGLWEKEGKFSMPQGGILKCAEVLNEDFTPVEPTSGSLVENILTIAN